MVNMLCNQQFVMFSSLMYKSICFLLALINIFYIFKLYFGYHVLTKVSPHVPFYSDTPKLSLCFDMTSVMSGRPQKEFFMDHLDILGETVGQLKQKMPQPENLIKHCFYRDWNTDSLILKRKDDCLKYFKIEMYLLQSYMCYKLTPREANYSFFAATNSLEVGRFLFAVAANSPLDQGHMILPIVHFGQKPFLDRFFANEILTSLTESERYIVTYNSYDLKSLPSPYESKCALQSPPECYIRCMDRGYKEQSRSFYRAIIFNENDSVIFPDLTNDDKAINSIYSAIEKPCHTLCPQVPACHLSFTVTKVARYPSIRKLAVEVQTLAKPAVVQKTIPVMLLLELFTQLTSVCSFWLGFSVIGLCEKLERSLQKKTSIKQLIALKIRATRLIRFTSLNTRQSRRRQLPVSAGDRIGRFHQVIKLSSSALKILAAILFSIAISSTMFQYFEYSTLTQITFRWNSTSSSNHAHLCFPLELMIDLPDLPDVTVDNYDEVFMERDRHFDQPLSQLMDRTNRVDQILAGCRLWNKTGKLHIVTRRPLRECLNNFITTKYFAAGDVCYSIGPKKTEKKQYSKHDLIQPGIFHSIILHRALKNMTFKTILLRKGDFPFISRRYAVKMYPFTGKQLYRLSTRYREEHLLPSPYETKCHPSIPKSVCLQNCLINKTVDATGYLPRSEIIKHPVPQRLKNNMVIGYTHLKNRTLLEKWTRIESDCVGRCRKPGCLEDSTVTEVSALSRSKVDFELMIGVRQEPDEITSTIPKTTLYWLFYQVFGCANFWLAFIILHANPFERWRIKSETSQKLNEEIHRFRLKLLGLVTILRINFGLQFERRKIISLRKLSDWTVRFLCACGTIFHTYLCVAEYSTFPTEVHIRWGISDEARNFSVIICNRLSLDSVSPNLADYYNGKVSRTQLDESFERLFNRSIGEVVGDRPPSVGRIVGCSFRGLPPGFERTKHEKDITDRILFRESTNSSICESIYKRQRLVICGQICDRYDEGKSKINYNQLLNEPDVLMGISTDRNVAGLQFIVVVGVPTDYPLIDSLFSWKIRLPKGEWWFDVSTTKYRENTPGPPYDHDGLSDVSLYNCHRYCLASRLSHFNLTFYSPEISVWHMKLLSKNHFRDPKIASIIEMKDEPCVARCLLSNPKTLTFYVTDVSRPLTRHRMKKNSVEFLLTVTKNPAIEVTFKPKWSLCELIIAIGSVLNIWWGLSALGLDSSRENTDSLAATEMDECKQLIGQMQTMLSSHLSVRTIASTRQPAMSQSATRPRLFLMVR